MSSPGSSRTLLVDGSVGVGKTTVAAAVGALLAARRDVHAVIDLDELRRGWPPPADDPFGTAVMVRNLAVVAEVYRARGHPTLVLAGVLESARDRADVADAVGGRLTVVRLVAPAEVVHGRIRQRHRTEPAELEWHLRRTGELHAIQEAAALQDAVLPAVADPSIVARLVLGEWERLSPS